MLSDPPPKGNSKLARRDSRELVPRNPPICAALQAPHSVSTDCRAASPSPLQCKAPMLTLLIQVFQVWVEDPTNTSKLLGT